MKTKLLKSPITNHQSLSSRGFTLIELLVVIGVLGIMAAALVATIDPIEQIRKAQDSNTRNAAVEYLNAVVRYYATHQYYPWDSTVSINTNTTCKTIAAASLNTGVQVYMNNSQIMDSCTQALLDEKELKAGFVADVSNITSKIYLSQQTVPAGDITVCFLPQSKSQKVDANTKYNQAGSSASGACTTGINGNCYWCAK